MSIGRFVDDSFLHSHDYGSLDNGVRYVEDYGDHLYVMGHSGLWILTRGERKVILYKRVDIDRFYQQKLDYKTNVLMKDDLVVKQYEELMDSEKDMYNYYARQYDLNNFVFDSAADINFGMNIENF